MIVIRTYSEMVEAVRERAGFDDDASAAAALEASLGAVGAVLPAELVHVVAEQLPHEAAMILWRDAQGGGESPEPEAVYERVAEREGVALGFGMEHAQVVCELLTELLTGEAHDSVCSAMPDLFRVHEPWPPPSRAPTAPGHRTLAEGRPGSAHPVSESGPTTHVIEDDSDSTLARGRGGSRRPLSGGGKG
jgi:uncharacterized protein (DUF2267 family)